jgi:pyruvate kinase
MNSPRATMNFPRATKIVATLGPSSTAPDTLRRLILAGVNVVRVNFSHGTVEEHIQTVRLVREISEEVKRDVGVLADLQGPKIRIGKFEDGKVTLSEGDRFAFDIDCDIGNQHQVGLDYKELVNDVKVGDTLLLNDGRMTMTVERLTDTRIECVVLVGGVLSNRKGINRQGGGLSAPALTAKDMEDIKTAVGFKADFIAVSFPKNAADMYMAREPPAARRFSSPRSSASRRSGTWRRSSRRPTASWSRAGTWPSRSAMPRFRPCRSG